MCRPLPPVGNALANQRSRALSGNPKNDRAKTMHHLTSPSVSKRTVTKDHTRSVVDRLTNWQSLPPPPKSSHLRYGVLPCSMAAPGPILDGAVNSPPLRREGYSRTGPCFPT
ncbi:hypothetical protein BP00DRAFT_38220 [Aspergillus indologenus CBS 114.80]|uniref:Uncharacterized protein n=1 Tax=Aspergillus indologenus CBS 114.80 TaxID=1450541 RepID=A0A2V5HT42_9EURO|nr:hypothetical protein BP00DRAFT_38220 [Aspergillus indologenus CBS 114.80]